jgi:DNA modification methylase
MIRLIAGDCREILPTLADQSVQCCVTSPPYFGLRDYGVAGQIGLEATPDAFVAELVAVFREVRRVLRDDGTLWLNLGDSYGAMQGKGFALHELNGKGPGSDQRARDIAAANQIKVDTGLRPKNLLGIPWRVAFALQADGWYLRQDIIWAKPNPMPESVTDRCTKAHEYVFLMSKQPRYFFDAEAIAEPSVEPDRIAQKTYNRPLKELYAQGPMARGANGKNHQFSDPERVWGAQETRNKRSVWTIATQPYAEAHFATFPPELAEICIKAGCPAGGTVLDPFAGAGTVGLVADRLQRDALLIELNPGYAEMIRGRIGRDAGMFAEMT